MKHLLPVAALLFFSASYGQDYVVTLKSDTIRGSARILSYDLLDRIQLVNGRDKTTYTAVQLRAASIKNETFNPVRYDNAIRMMKVIRSGFLSLYAFRLAGQVTYDGQILVKMGSNPAEVPNIGFKRYVGQLVEDCPDVADRVKTGEFDRKNITELVDRYNTCVVGIQERRIESAEKNVSNPTTDFIEQMKARVTSSDLATKAEVNDLLNSINEKVIKKEPVPSYMKEGLKSYLSQRSDFKEDMEQLLLLLDK